MMLSFTLDKQSEAQLAAIQRVLTYGERYAAEALWEGTGRALSHLRREFLKQTRVKLGKNPKSGKGESKTHNPRTRGMVFRWVRLPLKKSQVRKASQIKGALFTHSTAALGLEKGPTIRPTRGQWLVIPILNAGQPNTAKKSMGRERYHVKPTWKSWKIFKEKYGDKYRTMTSDKGSYKVIFAMRRYKQRKRAARAAWWPMFLMIRSVKMPDTLNFFDIFEREQATMEGKFVDSLDKMVKKMAGKERRGRSVFAAAVGRW